MDLELKDSIALISGASRGIGKAIAQALVAEGCRVVLCARGEAGLREAAAELEADAPGRVSTVALDLTERAAAARFVEAALDVFGGIDIVVNNVGGGRRMPF